MTAKVPDARAIQTWSAEYIAEMFKLPIGRIDPHSEFDDFGLDSSAAIAYVMSLEEWLGIEIAPELLFEHTTIASLSEHVVTLLKQEQES